MRTAVCADGHVSFAFGGAQELPPICLEFVIGPGARSCYAAIVADWRNSPEILAAMQLGGEKAAAAVARDLCGAAEPPARSASEAAVNIFGVLYGCVRP